MKRLIKKYLEMNCWYLYLLNIAIYFSMIFVQYRFIQTDSYYEQYMRPLFHSNEDYVKAVAESRFFELYNYLWVPVHIGAMVLLIGLCLFIGYNVLNYSISLKSCIKVSMQSIVVFSLNSIIITSLKACNVIAYSNSTVDDEYFLQSIGRLFISFKFPDFVYSLLEKINVAEMLFCIVLSFIITKVLSLKFKRSLPISSCIYLFGTIIYICFTSFINFFIN